MNYPVYERSVRATEPNEFARPSSALARREGREQPPRTNGAHTLAKALGWFSIGLGLTELTIPRRLGRSIGAGEQPTVLSLFGVREIATGIGILAAADPTNGVRARVAGDLVDLAFLGSAYAAARTRDDRVACATATAAVLGVTALDIYCATALGRTDIAARPQKNLIRVQKSIAVNRPLEELYAFWRQLNNLPQVMRHLHSVHELNAERSQWVALGPAGTLIQWEARITTDKPNELIAWQSLQGADVPNQGFVEFKRLPADHGAVVTVHVEYAPPGGRVTASVAKLFGRSPEQEIELDLRRWKQLMETGEVATTEGQPSGKRSMLSRHLP